jgi:hypothetical protein
MALSNRTERLSASCAVIGRWLSQTGPIAPRIENGQFHVESPGCLRSAVRSSARIGKVTKTVDRATKGEVRSETGKYRIDHQRDDGFTYVHSRGSLQDTLLGAAELSRSPSRVPRGSKWEDRRIIPDGGETL